MNRVLRFTFILSLLITAGSAFAQLTKIEQAIDDENFSRVLKLTNDAMEDKAMKKIPEIHFYRAQALFELCQDDFYLEKNPDAIKEALKSIKRGKAKDVDQNVVDEFTKVIDDVVGYQNDLADVQYQVNKLSKAMSMYDKAYAANQNRYSYLMSAKCAIAYEDTAKGELQYRQLIKWYNADPAADETAEQDIAPFVHFIDKAWQKQDLDSANHWIANGRAILGDHDKLNYYQKMVTLDKIKSMPPSTLVLDMVQQSIKYNPTDYNLLHRENALYIHLIKAKIGLKAFADADTLISQFTRQKAERYKKDNAAEVKKLDEFVSEKPENALWKLGEYYQIYGHSESGNYIVDQYMTTTAKSTSSADIADRWSVISEYAYKEKALPFASFVLQRAITKYPSNSKLTQLRSKIISDKENIRTNVDDQAAIYSLMKDESKVVRTEDFQERLVKSNEKYLGLLAAANRFGRANEILEELKQLSPNQDFSYRLTALAQEDFYQNYFQTKTKGKDQDGRIIEGYVWSGAVSGCEAGLIDEDIHDKVKNRINYFRRNAGVPEIVFDKATNEFCQDAALMMTANKKLSHNPPRNWRCYTNEGAYAAKHSLIIQDANTSMAVTYIMADKSPSAGNRRWLLYPNGKVYGHGSTNTVAVIWALDDSGSTDTSDYINQPVNWPPNGHIPQMMLFENWTFSLYQDLKGAKVVVKQDGKELDVKVEPYVRGYGAPTLVFKPTVNKAALPEKSDFDVTVTLSNGRKYSYTVHTFKYDPNR